MLQSREFDAEAVARATTEEARSSIYAHSRLDPSRSGWEPLAHHLHAVGERASEFAASFGWQMMARTAGRLHDIGKTSAAYQAYIAIPQQAGRKGPDHSTAGAREAERLYGSFAGRVIAYVVAGHHAGLADYRELERRTRDKALEDYFGWQAQAGPLPAIAALAPTRGFRGNAHAGFSEAFLIRMLFSCLVDADYLATEAFYDGAARRKPADLVTLQPRLADLLAAKRRDDTELNQLRACVLDDAVAKAGLDPGLFTLTVPTGGGKTLISLAFAMEHARLHALRRVIYVIPYTSIVEQSAAVFREAVGTTEDVLEHHASFDWEPQRSSTEEADEEGQAGLAKLRKASENWDAPIVVTTAVQFFESLFARQPSRCRKLHNIAGSVVVLDEAQTLPLRLLRPCMAALNELATNYRTSVVLCTATQPALRICDGFEDKKRAPNESPQKVGFCIDGSRELAPDPEALYAALKRVNIVRRHGKTEDAEIVERFAEQPQMLCIVNSRRHARELFDRLKADSRTSGGARHLTTLMCPVHRRAVLAEVREQLSSSDPKPVRLVATSLIEAGVDIDFPEVWRAVAGLDSIAQAAGRCNREGRLERGRTVVFDPADKSAPADLRPLIECTEKVFQDGLDPLSLDGVRGYFQELYWRRGAEAMDAATLDGRPWPILERLRERIDPKTRECTFDFETIASVFRLIDDAQETVIVPYDEAACTILRRMTAMDRPSTMDLRKLQQYAVSVPKRDRDAWLAAGVLRAVHPAIGEALLRFEDRAHYRDDTGVDLLEPERRDAAANLI
jgi:CRISPR-associated endonuclease/helicase Cas3